MKRFLTALLLCFPLAVHAATQGQAVRHFEAVAFGGDFGSGTKVLIRWPGKVRWTFATDTPSGAQEIERRISRQFETISKLTGLEFERVSSPGDAYLVVAVASQPVLEASYRQMGSSVDLSGRDGFARVLQTNRGLIAQGFAGIRADIPKARQITAVLVEATQTMGLMRDAAVITPSITAPGHMNLTELPWIDRLMLAVLYDPRLAPGMPKAEAMKIVPSIIAELWPRYAPD